MACDQIERLAKQYCALVDRESKRKGFPRGVLGCRKFIVRDSRGA